MPVIKIYVKKNNLLDRRVQEKKFCCPVAYFKLRLRPQDTIKGLSEELGVCTATIKNNRKALREGKLLCQRREGCLAALWLTPSAIKKHEEFLRKENDGKGI